MRTAWSGSMVVLMAALGAQLGACGGGTEAGPAPHTPATPAADAGPVPTASSSAATTASTEKPKGTMADLQAASLKSLLEALNARDAKKLGALYAEDAVVNSAGAPERKGRAEIEKERQELFEAFAKDFKVWVVHSWSKGDMMALQWAWSGTSTGTLQGLKDTPKPAGATGLSVLWFNADGSIKKESEYMDGVTVRTQLGQIPGRARPVPTATGGAETHAAKGSPEEEKNVEAAKAFFAALEGKKEADFLNLLTDDATYDDMASPAALKGKAEARKFFTAFTKAFPDQKFNVTNVFGAGDWVIAETTMTGTHKGPLGPFAPTKKPVTLHSADVLQMKDGKITHGSSFTNLLEFLAQTGLDKGAPPKKP